MFIYIYTFLCYYGNSLCVFACVRVRASVLARVRLFCPVLFLADHTSREADNCVSV